jgi:hypothetical protein
MPGGARAVHVDASERDTRFTTRPTTHPLPLKLPLPAKPYPRAMTQQTRNLLLRPCVACPQRTDDPTGYHARTETRPAGSGFPNTAHNAAPNAAPNAASAGAVGPPAAALPAGASAGASGERGPGLTPGLSPGVTPGDTPAESEGLAGSIDAPHKCELGQPGATAAWCLTRMMDCRKVRRYIACSSAAVLHCRSGRPMCMLG